MKVDGLKELEDALVALGKKAAGRAMRRALNNSTAPIKRAAKRGVDSERVKKSIKSKVYLGKGAKSSVATVHVGVLGKDAWIGNFIEGGTKAHDIPAKRRKGGKVRRVAFGGKVFGRVHHPGVKAKPFMKPAWDNNYRGAVKILRVRLRERIVIEALKQAKK